MVHGPLVLGRGTGVVVGVRCVFGHPTGLHLPTVIVASGVHAQAAQRQSGHQYLPTGYQPSEPPGWSYLELRAELNGRSGEMQPFASTSSSNEDSYYQEANYWIEELPADGVLRLSVAWPRVGLDPSTVVVTMQGLPEAVRGAIPLA